MADLIENKLEEQVVVFHLKEQTYGVDIATVYEIIRMENITRVPGTPPFVEGISNLRGRIIPVIDLCKRFGLEQSEVTQSTRIIIVDLDGNTVGMIVDAVSEVLRFPTNVVEPPPPIVNGIGAEYLRGVALWDQRLIILLNLKKILNSNEKESLTSMDTDKFTAMA